MRNYRLDEFKRELITVVGRHNLLTEEASTLFYRTGIRVGNGSACVVAFPRNLFQLWRILQICIACDGR